jgi:hypothetical protein
MKNIKLMVLMLAILAFAGSCHKSLTKQASDQVPDQVLDQVENQVADDFAFEIIEDKSIIITRYRGNAETLNIPEEINDLTVTAIGDNAFNSCKSLTSVIIPSSELSIGRLAFYGCDNLASITFSRQATVGEMAFPDSTQIIYRN